jgi:hypothetical protein
MRNITLHLTHFERPKESGVGVEVASVELPRVRRKLSEEATSNPNFLLLS